MPKRINLYTGRAGQMAVMAEFLIRGYNVAVPEVDVGDDILVVQDQSGEYWRIQVKTAIAKGSIDRYHAKYSVRVSQIEATSSPETWFVFASRLNERWHSYLVLPRVALANLYLQDRLGAPNQRGSLLLNFNYAETTVTCLAQDFSRFLNNWEDWSTLQHDT